MARYAPTSEGRRQPSPRRRHRGSYPGHLPSAGSRPPLPGASLLAPPPAPTWPEDEREPMRAWLEAQLLRPPVPCSFPDLKLSRRLDDEATIATLERCCPQAAQ